MNKNKTHNNYNNSLNNINKIKSKESIIDSINNILKILFQTRSIFVFLIINQTHSLYPKIRKLLKIIIRKNLIKIIINLLFLI